MRELTDATFVETITNDKLTVVDFWAPWCGPCRMLGPIFEEVASALEDRATFAKINIDDHSEAASQYGVRSIPTLMIFRGGELVGTKTGVLNKDALTSWIEGELA